MDTSLQSVIANCAHIVPELILIATLCVVILFDVMQPLEKSRNAGYIVLVGVALAFFFVVAGYGDHPAFIEVAAAGETAAGPQYAFSGTVVIDKLSDFFKSIMLLGTFLVVLFTFRSVEIRNYRYGEYYTLMLGAVVGGSFLVSSNNLLLMVLSLETLSLCSYVLVGYLKHNRLSAESSLKYILYGSVASGVMLFGISYIYGMAGTLDLSKALLAISYGEDNGMAILISFVLVVGGLGFKMAAVPFHFWAPDAYQGAPTPVTAFLAVVSKAAGFAAALRVFLPLFATSGAAIPEAILAVRGPLSSLITEGQLPVLFYVLSVLTMTLGNLVAIRQRDVKRLMAYSSIAHAGYLLMGLTVFSNEALEAVLLYFLVYLFMTLGTFFVIILMINESGTADLDSYKGLIYRNPLMAIAMIVFLLSLTGLPPTAGFIGKLKLFEVVVSAGTANIDAQGNWGPLAYMYISLVVIAAINTVISLYYYWKIAKTMTLDKAEKTVRVPVGLFDNVMLLVYSVPVAFLIVALEPFIGIIQIFNR